ncbi:hypothetical protein OF83DRAFT_1068492 [Amylostereum chailletii]|nr:hypothetical protein OF83DRAFT_1068492 [Amylostereum chailletii]
MEAKWQDKSERAQRKEREARRQGEEARRRAEEVARTEKRRVREAWAVYEDRWRALRSPESRPSKQNLTFASIPWPVFAPPRSAADITAGAVEKFILSPAHSEGVARRDRIRDALRRWHPDNLGSIALRKRLEMEKRAVEDAVGAVARCLNELLTSEESKVQ